MPLSVASDPGRHCLYRLVCLNTLGMFRKNAFHCFHYSTHRPQIDQLKDQTFLLVRDIYLKDINKDLTS